MAAQLIGAELRLAEFGRGRAAAGRVQVGQVAGRRRAPGAEARPDSEAGRAGLTGSASLVGGANGPGPGGLAGLTGGPGRGGRTGLVSGAGPVRADAAIRPGKGRHWGLHFCAAGVAVAKI
jgi:hypothetical protein